MKKHRGVENKLGNLALSACIRWMRDLIRGSPEWTDFAWFVVVGGFLSWAQAGVPLLYGIFDRKCYHGVYRFHIILSFMIFLMKHTTVLYFRCILLLNYFLDNIFWGHPSKYLLTVIRTDLVVSFLWGLLCSTFFGSFGPWEALDQRPLVLRVLGGLVINYLYTTQCIQWVQHGQEAQSRTTNRRPLRFLLRNTL